MGSRYGYDALEKYWRFLAESCFIDVIERFKTEGLEGIKEYYEHSFSMDDGEFSSYIEDEKLIFDVKKCPDYEFMKSSDNPNFIPIHNYCRHHDVINSILAERSGYFFNMSECSNSGTCKWVFEKKCNEKVSI